ncbi:MAG: dockerin type I repeat-containing protein [candidate division Zixibacteria bacterium]|nr:dockerin type I repeat-containing protein [candidate division Zixibacteria bacterium]
MSVLNVTLGDWVRIKTKAHAGVNLIAVTADNMGTQPTNYVIWDGHNYDDQVCAAPTRYLVTINNDGQFQRLLHGYSPINPVFTGINYTNGNLAWSLANSFAYVRCFIYDASNNLIARPIWDKLYSANYPQSLDVRFLPPGQTYTAKFFGWCPDGGKSQTVSYSFTPCTSCGDANSDGEIDLSDAVFLIAYIYSGGAAPGDCNYPKGMGDANGSGTVDISDATYLIEYIFSGGPAPHCQGL